MTIPHCRLCGERMLLSNITQANTIIWYWCGKCDAHTSDCQNRRRETDRPGKCGK